MGTDDGNDAHTSKLVAFDRVELRDKKWPSRFNLLWLRTTKDTNVQLL